VPGHTSPNTEDDQERPNPGSIIAPSPLLVLGSLVSGIVLDRFERVTVLPRPWNVAIGGLSFVTGTVLFGGAIQTMGRAGTGPSHDEDSPRLIAGGVFRYTRNPIYLGNCLQHVGLSLVYNSLWPIVTLVPVVAYLVRVIDREEAYLEAVFGDEFENRRENGQRWL